MLYLNLRGDAPRKRLPLRHGIKSALLGLFTFVVVGSSYFWVPPEEAPVRPLSIEERETVLATLAQVPRAEVFSEQFADEDLASFLELEPEGENLVRREDDTIFFSSKFFVADSVSQRKSLGEVISGYAPVPPPSTGEHAAPNEIAVVGE